MWVHVDTSSGLPVYIQIMNQIRSAAATGVVRTGEALPSVRELAVELAINPNTVARAYKELQQEGVIEVVRGKGTFVSDKPPKIADREVKDRIRRGARSLATEAYTLGYPRGDLAEDIEEAVDNVYGKDTDGNKRS